MTKRAWVELIQSHLAGGAVPADLESRLHPLIIEKYFDVVYSGLLYQVSANAIMFRDWSQLDAYCKAYKNVAISKDSARNEYYSILPASIIELPENRGIRLISPMQDQKNKFTYSTNNAEDVWSELDHEMVTNDTSFYREGGNVYYRKLDTACITPGLLFKLIVPLNEFDDDEEIGIPGQQSAQVFSMITDMLLRRPPEDVIEDNNSKQI